jgi:hypothetical protein
MFSFKMLHRNRHLAKLAKLFPKQVTKPIISDKTKVLLILSKKKGKVYQGNTKINIKPNIYIFILYNCSVVISE